MLISCNYNLIDQENNQGNDTITGWEWAGILSSGNNGQHIDICYFQGNLFTFNYRGELFQSKYPGLSWNKMSIPGGNKVYDMVCDAIKGVLYIVTRQKICTAYEYNILNSQWKDLTPQTDSWFDSTKLYNDELHTLMYSVALFDNKIFIMTVQTWTDIFGKTQSTPTIWCSNRNSKWEKADSGWISDKYSANTITNFYSTDNFLWASSFENGLWRYDGVKWMVIPGTRQEDVYYLDTSGGDINTIPGFRPRSLVKHGDDIYIGNLGGYVHKLLPGFNWDRVGLFFKDYNVNDTFEFGNPSMSLYSYNGYLIKQTYYYNNLADLWFNMTPKFNKIDPTYINGLPGTVYGMINIGDTLFAALGNNEGKHSGVYFLDLKTRKWFNRFH